MEKRREFIKGGIAGGVAAAAFPYIGNAALKGDKIRMGFIGIGNRGSQLLQSFMRMPDVSVEALCDVYDPYLKRDRAAVDPKIIANCVGEDGKVPWFIPDLNEKFEKQPKLYKDYRKMLENKDIDAVCIGTPDHWHALQVCDSVAAGKDVYCEKPLTRTVAEGRFIVDFCKRTDRVVAVGIQRRSAASFRELKDELRTGKYGNIVACRHFWSANYGPNGIGKCAPTEPSPGLDWNSWLGPEQYVPFRYTLCPYMFRWHYDFCNQLANQGVHSLDAFRWLMDETSPVAVSATGGRYWLDDDGDVPDTMSCTWEFADKKLIQFSIYEAGQIGLNAPRELEIVLSDGAAYLNGSNGYKIIPSTRRLFHNPKKPTFAPVEKKVVEKVILKDNSGGSATDACVRNFCDCVKSRNQPNVTLEEGHRSTLLAHIANIACRVKMRLEWDGVKERFTNSEEANKLLACEYRPEYKRYPGLG